MMDKSASAWHDFVVKHRAYSESLKVLLRLGPKNLDILRTALSGPDRYEALTVIEFLDVNELSALLPELVGLAGSCHDPIEMVRPLILKIPRQELLTRIEPIIQREIDTVIAEAQRSENVSDPEAEVEDAYRRYLELLESIDADLCAGLAEQAMSYPGELVQEAGQSFYAKRQNRSDYS